MATLLSVNVGLPKDVAWRGRTVHTGVWKSPVSGSQMVRRLNIDGDGQGDLAGHGGEQRAVLVYQVESYRHWAEVLGRDDLEHGAFGENFTVDGLADDEACIGDRYRIGEAEFEVTQPRVTCFRVGMRLGEPRLPSLLVAHHRPGFYLRVLTEGRVRAGDEIIRTARGRHGLTVADVDALLYLPGHDGGRLATALDVPALSPGWRESFRSMLENDAQEQPGRSPGRPATVLARVPRPRRHRRRPGERVGHVVPPRRGRGAAGISTRSVHHPARARERWCGRRAHLLPVGRRRGRYLSDQREARAARAGQCSSVGPTAQG